MGRWPVSDATPIGKGRYKVAKHVEEPSKFAVMKENAHLWAACRSMQQLLAALMMELPGNIEAISFRIEDLESINPDMVKVELVEGDCHVRLVVPENLTNPTNPADLPVA